MGNVMRFEEYSNMEIVNFLGMGMVLAFCWRAEAHPTNESVQGPPVYLV